MTSTAIELAPQGSSVSTFEVLGRAHELAEAVARTEFVPRALRGKADAVLACILAGHEMGIGPMQSLAKIHVIDGRPGPAAELMRGIVQSRGHQIWWPEISTTRVTIAGQRAGDDHPTTVTWTIDDAKRAGLAGKENWRKYPRAMLEARCTGELCRLIFADVLAGLSYTAEEIQDGFEEWDRIEEPAPEPAAQQTRQLGAKKAPAKKAAAKKRPAPRQQATPPPTATAPVDEDRPPLPGEDDDDVVDAEIIEDTPTPPDDDLAKRRAQQIAMRARDLDLDHHDIVAAVTGGRETSAKAITQDQAAEVLDVLRRLKLGELVLDTTPDVPTLADAPPPQDPQDDGGDVDLGDAAGWDGDQWRAWLRTQGVKVVEVMREAKRLAAEAGQDEPMRLDDLRSLDQLPVLLAVWVEDQATARGDSR